MSDTVKDKAQKQELCNDAKYYGQKAIDAINKGFPENTYCYWQESPEYFARKAATCARQLIDYQREPKYEQRYSR